MQTPVSRVGRTAGPAAAGPRAAQMPASRKATPSSSSGLSRSLRMTRPAGTARSGAVPRASG